MHNERVQKPHSHLSGNYGTEDENREKNSLNAEVLQYLIQK